MKLQVQSRSGKKLADLTLKDTATLLDLKKAFQAHNRKYVPERQRLTMPSTQAGSRPRALTDDSALLSQLGVTDVVVFKDLGPQISWKMVFVLEYLGPMLVFALFSVRPAWIYSGKGATLSLVPAQRTALVMFEAHYAKRELETLFVHRFSNATMPLMNLFKNCTYYWGFAAAIAYFLFHPLYTPAGAAQQRVGLALFVVGELLNALTHYQLAQLRPKGTRVRAIPQGRLFSLVSCPNYTFEILSWIGFNIFSSTLLGWLFALAGALQMTQWALKKHANYRREFNGHNGTPMYPRSRRAIVPFLL